MSGKTVAVVGLGLIGGSIAMALKGFEDYQVVGAVRSQKTYDFAVAHGVCDRVTMDAAQAVREADVVWLCLPPQAILDFMEAHREDFKPGSVVTDVCGVKTSIVEGAKCLPPTVDFIGCHPMAGKEVSGIDNAEGSLFRNTHFIITPGEHSAEEHIALLYRMAEYCRFGDVTRTTPERHDELIAYTSQLMHVIAVSVCDGDDFFSCQGFEGGSFRDCTRVASLDVPMWTQLFTLNAPALAKTVEALEGRLREYRAAIESNDREKLAAMLESAAGRKKQVNLERARGDDVRPRF